MRRSASSDRLSIAPLRVKNDENARPSSSKKSRPRSSTNGADGFQFGRRSIANSRMSTDGGARKSLSVAKFGQSKQNRLSRGSGIGVRNINGVPKDPRPTSDKGYQQKCSKALLQFLMDNHYRHDISPKVLQSPTSKDFFKIFQFISSFLLPGFKLSMKPEEEVPKIFKAIGYPLMISRSSMFAIGSPHTWPHILVALIYMIDLIQYSSGTDEHVEMLMFPPEDDVFDSISEKQIQYSYLVSAYTSFMNGNDQFEEEDGEYKRAIKQKLLGGAGGVDDMIEENNSLEQQVELLEQDKDRLKGTRQKVQVIQHDVDRLDCYIKELETHRQERERALVEVEEQLNTLNVDLEAESAKILKMQLIFEQQKFSQEDVERINMKRRELSRQRDEVDRLCQSVDEDIWKEEMAMSKEMEQIETKFMHYNKLAHSLKLIPLTAENSSGFDYEMKKPAMDGTVSDFQNKIKPALVTVKKQCSEAVNQKESEKITQLATLEQVSDRLMDIENEVSLLESKHKRAEDEVESKRQMFQRELQTTQEAIDDMQSELVQMETLHTSHLSDHQLVTEKQRASLRQQQDRQKIRKRLKDHKEFFMQVLQVFIDHMETIKTILSEAAQSSEKQKLKVEEEMKCLGIAS